MSSYGGTSNEVAEDFLYALKDLNMNSRYEISNLTVIAKENTEHALAISEALKNHIKQTAPIKKLPAFYVLDSIVKNVGTPYTLFFGRQLFSTFMEAYALVDTNTRRKMDEMLKTWKEPVPGSIDTRPVFPPEVTRPIETALIKARTSAVQAQQQHLKNQQQIFNRGRPSPVPFHRDTPTPPNNVRQPQQAPPGYPPYGQQQYAAPMNDHQYNQTNENQAYGLPQHPPSQQYPPAASSSNWQQAQSQGYRAQETSIDALNSDIANLILTSKADFAQNPYDSSIQTRLKALLDLQTILQSQRLPPDQIALIRDQVAALSEASKQPPPNQTPARPVPQPVPIPATVPPAQTPSLESVLGPGAHSALAALLARQSATPQIATPPPQTIRSPQPTTVAPSFIPPPTTQSTPVPNPTSLLEQLKAAGILKGPPAANTTPPVPAVPVTGALPPGFSIPFLGTPQPLPTGLRVPLAEIPNDVELKASSLKIPRPHLISSLYERLGAPCTQCGRRFQSDEEGKKKKAAHMDWHFRVHQRMTEAEKRGQHRSWYVDELDWIKTREDEDGHHNETADGSKASNESNSATAAKPRVQYLPVPDDPNANKVCPICQENFETKWLDDAQEWVWMDTQKVGKIIYHASCFAEVSKDDVSHQVKSPILGKRKAEDEHIALRAKIKTEPIY